MNNIKISQNELAVWSRYLQKVCGIYIDASKD
jgi:hypothetical protein